MRLLRRYLIVLSMLVITLILGVTGVSAQSRIYIVGSGDVLDLIAAYFNVNQYCIVNATPGLSNPSRLYPNQQLVIPYACAPYNGSSWRGGRVFGRIYAAPSPVPGNQGGGGTYVVRPGDQLGWIARYYGASLTCLVQVNHIYNPNLIYAGQRLSIAPCQTPNPQLPGGPVYHPPATTYTVQAGDSLTSIAQRFGVTTSCLVRINALPNQNLIRRGQVLQIGGCMGYGTGLGQGGGTNTTYTVQRGDRLSNIAATFGIDVQCLIEVNNIGNPNHIEAGEVLNITYSACSAEG